MSSFGFGGTNAKICGDRAGAGTELFVEQAPDPAVMMLVVSGKSSERIASMARALAEWMAGAGAEVGLADVAHTLNHHRTHHAKFATVCAGYRAQASSVCSSWAMAVRPTGAVAAL